MARSAAGRASGIGERMLGGCEESEEEGKKSMGTKPCPKGKGNHGSLS
jgi:hypothetical protein